MLSGCCRNRCPDVSEIRTGQQKKSGHTGDTTATILGAKLPVKTFYSRFYNGSDWRLASESIVKESEISTTDTLVDLHIKGSNPPDYLKNYLPDINSNESGKIYESVVNGQKRVLMIGDFEDDLVRIIISLPDDFLKTIK